MFFKYKNTIVILIISLIISIINFNAYLMGYEPNTYQAISSLLFISLWFVYGLFKGYKKIEYFKKFSTLYWGIGALLFVICYLGNLDTFIIPVALIFAGPMYGLRYFIELPSDINFVAISIALTYGSSIIGYFIGKRLNKK